MTVRLGRELQKRLLQVLQRQAIGKVGAILLAIPAACLALVLLGVMDVRMREQRIEQDIRSIEQRVKMSEQVLRYVVDQETGVRGYLLTQDKQFLTPYSIAKKELLPAIATLKQQSSEQSEILNQLERHIQKRLQQTEKLLKFAQSIDTEVVDSSLLTNSKDILSSAEAAQLLAQLRQAKTTTNAIRQTVETFKQQQQQALLQKGEQLNQSKQFVDRVQIMGAFLSVLSYLGVVSLFQMLDRRMLLRDQEVYQTRGTIQTLTSHLVDGVLMLYQDGRIESMNPAAEHILGYDSPWLVGQPLVDVLFPLGLEPESAENRSTNPDRPHLLPSPPAAIEWLQAKAKTGSIEQIQARQANGQMIPIELSISETAVGTAKFIVLLRDVSERVQLTDALSDKVIELGELNQQLFAVNTVLQRKNQSLETFVTAAAHDLKTPIRGIASLAQWLETDLGETMTPENQTLLQLLRQRVLRMQAIADGLLSYASIDAWAEQQAVVDTRALVQEVCQRIPVPPTFAVQIEGVMPTLRTPHLALRLVFDQLIRNAIDHHDRGQGIIQVIATPQEHCTEFVIRDDGPGIAPAYRDRVLRMFQVLEQNPDTFDKIGVGLALVHKAIQLVGGRLDLTAAHPGSENRSESGLPVEPSDAQPAIDRGLEVRFTWPLLE